MDLDRVELRSPIGTLELETGSSGLRALSFRGSFRPGTGTSGFSVEVRVPSSATEIVARLKDYFAGEIHVLDEIAVDPRGTPFQLEVWRALRTIRAGTTVSYGDLAKRLGRPAAVRAVGLCNARNPIALVVPCHRVIGADGSLTGYGGGLDRKRWLLGHERGQVLILES